MQNPRPFSLIRSLLLALPLGILAPTLHSAAPEQLAESAILPFLDVLASPPANEARSFRIQGKIESIGTQNFATPQPFDFSVQPPGRLRLTLPSGNDQITACRDGQRAWISPASVVQPLLKNPQGPKRKKEFPPMELPFSGKQLALLPVLLEVQDKGSAPLDGTNCRVVDVRMQPDISRLMPPEAKGWAVRLWLNPQGQPARAGIQAPGASAVLKVDRIQFSQQLPPQLWAPPADALSLTPAEFEEITSKLMGRDSTAPGGR